MNLVVGKLWSFLFAVSLTVSVFIALIWSFHWPLVGDASLMHYVVFLLEKGYRPYRDVIDINLPGTYFFEAFAMRVFGWDAIGWRLYDLVLALLTACGFLLMAGRRQFYAALTASAVFFLVHAQDGIGQLGQRDLLIGVLLVWAYATLFLAQEREDGEFLVFCSMACIGCSLTIKPLFLPLGAVLLVMTIADRRRRKLKVSRYLFWGLAGLFLEPLLVFVFLKQEGSWQDFVLTLNTLIPLHAELGRRPFLYLVTHAISAVEGLFVLWFLLMIFLRSRLSLERVELLLGLFFALASFVLQGKGYPYQRYPLLALMIFIVNLDAFEAVTMTGVTQWIAYGVLALECLVLAPTAAWRIHTFRPKSPFSTTLSADLEHYGPDLNGKIQCLDTFGGCIETLYNERMTQSTGFLYDCYLFTPHQDEATRRYRDAFWKSFLSARPELVVVTDQFCLETRAALRSSTIGRRWSTSWIRSTPWIKSGIQRRRGAGGDALSFPQASASIVEGPRDKEEFLVR